LRYTTILEWCRRIIEVGEMAALPLAERKVRTPQDMAPLKRRTPPLAGMASATESKHPNSYVRK